MALDRVLEQLTAGGIHAQLIKRIADRCAIKLYSTGETLWHPPKLIIYADAGWRIATVTIGLAPVATPSSWRASARTTRLDWQRDVFDCVVSAARMMQCGAGGAWSPTGWMIFPV